MKRALLAAVLILASSIAFADATSDLLDGEKVRSMSAEEYAAAVRNAPDVNVRDKDGTTPLHVAVAYAAPVNIAILVIAGARVDARDDDWRTPLHEAAVFGTPSSIAMLVSAVANVNARDKYGFTPLHLAAWKGTPDNIVALLDAGASGSMKDGDGKTPFDLAGGNDKVKGTSAYRALNDAQYK